MNEIVAWVQESWGLIILVTGIALGAAQIFDWFRWFKEKIWKRVHDMFLSKTVKTQLTELSATVQLIAKELRPNSGSSLRDVVDGIESRQILQTERVQALMMDYPEGVKEFDVKGELVWCNRTYLRMIGRDFQEVMGNGWLSIVSVDDRDWVRDEWQAAVRDGRNLEMGYHEDIISGGMIKLTTRSTVMRSSSSGQVIGFMQLVTYAK